MFTLQTNKAFSSTKFLRPDSIIMLRSAMKCDLRALYPHRDMTETWGSRGRDWRFGSQWEEERMKAEVWGCLMGFDEVYLCFVCHSGSLFGVLCGGSTVFEVPIKKEILVLLKSWPCFHMSCDWDGLKVQNILNIQSMISALLGHLHAKYLTAW